MIAAIDGDTVSNIFEAAEKFALVANPYIFSLLWKWKLDEKSMKEWQI